MTRLGLLAGAIQSIFAMLVLLGVIDLTDEQLAGIMVAVNAILSAVYSWFEPSIPVGRTE